MNDTINMSAGALTKFTEPRRVWGKIGIGITTHNRPDMFKQTMNHLMARMPRGCELAIIDDCSNEPYAHGYKSVSIDMVHRFDSNVGIARAKNKALELLYNADCDHFFLFDDDTYPLVDNWWKPYVESKEPHLMYIFEHFANAKGPNDMIKIYQDEEISAYSHVRGCMLYYKRICLDTVGGMDVAFGKWGHEHGDLSNRIYSAGLTRFRYMDVANSQVLFYAADEQEHGKFVSTVPGAQRIDLLNKSKAIYEAQYNSNAYREFRDETSHGSVRINKLPLFLSTYFTTLGDPQRKGEKWQFDWGVTVDYRQSIYFKSENGCKNVILHDHDKTGHHEPDTVLKWIQVSVQGNPYFQRWISYYEYLIRHKDEVSWVFMTDCTDVELLKMPEPERGKIYTGDEPGLIGHSDWLKYYHKHPDLVKFYAQYRNRQMMNAGILGGYVEDVLPFIRAIIDTYTHMRHQEERSRVPGPGMTDMAVFNYVAHTRFWDQIIHGPTVNTEFKKFDKDNKTAWFRHK